jgi:stage IV sporulation protein FB
VKYTAGIGRVFGIPLRVHATFPLILVVYAADAWRSGTASDALRAVALVLAIFACVVLHELGHCLQARRYGIRFRDIVLFPIGGVARAESLPERPRHEIMVAIAGPAVNFALAAILFSGLAMAGTPPHGEGFLVDLAWANLGLGVFNLTPAFPMDGGRILRGALATRLSYLDATRRARAVGQLLALGFATLAFLDFTFAMLSVIAVLVFVGGMLEERAIRARVLLSGRRVGDLVDAETPVLSAGDRVESATRRVGNWTAPAYAVAGDAGSLAGVVAASDLMRALRDGRADDELLSIARRDFPVAEASTEASRVYRYLREANKPFAAVVDGDRFVGLFHAADGW